MPYEQYHIDNEDDAALQLLTADEKVEELQILIEQKDR